MNSEDSRAFGSKYSGGSSIFEEHGGKSTRSASSGIDPLVQHGDLYESRLIIFHRKSPPASEIFVDLIHGNLDSLTVYDYSTILLSILKTTFKNSNTVTERVTEMCSRRALL